ncbi:TetR/AcrR family transcriptional regulator [Actinocorallia populi]|uniref:TetR/AcrR family transcriptional regulator n=1 Tax=Actinocorallia populi TaxID=2079200 RepID=UPI000D097E55|nr:TetR/AcrR family transcriptional regulator [Actinocorallia populi]
MNKREESKRRTRTALLEAARTVIRDRGLPAATARDVAAEAGVAVGTVFVHFPTMGALAETLVDETVEKALVRAGVIPGADAPPPGGAGAGAVERLVEVSAALYDAYGADPELSRQVLAGSLFQHAPGGPAAERLRAFQEWVVRRLAEGRAAGEIADLDPEEAFLGFFSLYFGVLVAGLSGRLDRPAQLRTLRSSLTRLLGAEGDRSRWTS